MVNKHYECKKDFIFSIILHFLLNNYIKIKLIILSLI